MKHIRVHDKNFKIFIPKEEIENRVAELGEQITSDYQHLQPLFIVILNGAFIFAADLLRNVDILSDISFVKLSSYKGIESTGKIMISLPVGDNIAGRHVIIVEDIVDTGKTLSEFLHDVWRLKPASVKIASLLSKPDAMQFDIKPDYVCFSIPDKFVVGYGLDYDGLGRNLPDLYVVDAQ